jgi:hypothetical protein
MSSDPPAGERPPSVPDQVRAACAWVAARAHAVRIDEDAIGPYAAALAPSEEGVPDPATQFTEGDREGRAAFAVCLNAINFGSGWWPTIRKRPDHSGFFTIAAGLAERFREPRPWSPAELTQLGAPDLATVLDQEPEHPLMAQFAASLRDVGTHLVAEHAASFTAAIDSAAGSAPALATLFASWDAFADVSTYPLESSHFSSLSGRKCERGRPVPFFKRAQLAAADVHRAAVAELRDLDRLTAFADNLVPHVLRVDGVLRFDHELVARIEAGDLLIHDSPEEVELRACAVQAVELLAATRPDLTPAQIDATLWNRGGAPRYKWVPRPRSRNTAY